MLDMFNVRYFVVVVIIFGGKILVVGGYRDMEFKVIEVSCEIFDLMVNQWSLVVNLVVFRVVCGIVNFDNYVYFFGGEDFNQDGDLIYYDGIECYSI